MVMKIALDWDDTFTIGPIFWGRFILQAKESGHDIRIVTMRHERGVPEILHTLRQMRVPEIPVIATDHQQKRKFCADLGWFPHIWIDDTPEYIVALN